MKLSFRAGRNRLRVQEYIFMFRLLMIGMSGLTMTEWILTDFFMP
jgi:hypothetical protein